MATNAYSSSTANPSITPWRAYRCPANCAETSPRAAPGVGRRLTARDRFIAHRVGPELKRRGLLFAGIDVIGDYLTEINVTCPTCIRELDEEFSLDIASTLMDKIETKIAQK